MVQRTSGVKTRFRGGRMVLRRRRWVLAQRQQARTMRAKFHRAVEMLDIEGTGEGRAPATLPIHHKVSNGARV